MPIIYGSQEVSEYWFYLWWVEYLEICGAGTFAPPEEPWRHWKDLACSGLENRTIVTSAGYAQRYAKWIQNRRNTTVLIVVIAKRAVLQGQYILADQKRNKLLKTGKLTTPRPEKSCPHAHSIHYNALLFEVLYNVRVKNKKAVLKCLICFNTF